MADYVLSKTELEDLFLTVTADITGFSGDGKAGTIRFGYPEEGQPGWSRDENVVCIIVAPIDNPYDKQQNFFENTDDPDECLVGAEYTRVYQISWIIYGPDSQTLADQIKREIGWEPALNTLYDESVAPLTEIEGPQYFPYHFQGRWWERTDIRALFNVGTRRERTVGYIETADIEIYTDKGLQRTVHAPPDQALAGEANAQAQVIGDLEQA